MDVEAFKSTINFLFLDVIVDTLLWRLIISWLELIIDDYADVTFEELFTQSGEDITGSIIITSLGWRWFPEYIWQLEPIDKWEILYRYATRLNKV